MDHRAIGFGEIWKSDESQDLRDYRIRRIIRSERSYDKKRSVGSQGLQDQKDHESKMVISLGKS